MLRILKSLNVSWNFVLVRTADCCWLEKRERWTKQSGSSYRFFPVIYCLMIKVSEFSNVRQLFHVLTCAVTQTRRTERASFCFQAHLLRRPAHWSAWGDLVPWFSSQCGGLRVMEAPAGCLWEQCAGLPVSQMKGTLSTLAPRSRVLEECWVHLHVKTIPNLLPKYGLWSIFQKLFYLFEKQI